MPPAAHVPANDLAGLSYSLTAAAEGAPVGTSPVLLSTIRSAAAGVRSAIRQLRTLLVEIHPPNLRTAGLGAALADSLARVSARGVATSLDVDDDLRLTTDEELLLFRAAGEAFQNVERHAGAASVAVRVKRVAAGTRLEVVDDGVGFGPDDREHRRAEGHLGLSLLEDLAAREGARLDVQSEPGRGTVFTLEVPDQ